MRVRPIAALLLLAAVRPLSAQTADQARLMLSIGTGVVTGADLWQIPNQPVYEGVSLVDTFDLNRRIRPAWGVIFSGTYFPGEHFGFTGEAFLIGLGTEDACRLRFASGSSQNAQVCTSLQGAQKSATAVAVSSGLIYRIGSHKRVSPYFRGNLGVTISQQSTLRTIGSFADPIGQTVDKIIYSDPKPSHLTWYTSIGAGLTFVAGRGYQVRFEGRDNYLSIPVVTGATIRDGQVPFHRMKGKHLFSLSVAFDVVLERRRGRRY
jgi:hypothetical protein